MRRIHPWEGKTLFENHRHSVYPPPEGGRRLVELSKLCYGKCWMKLNILHLTISAFDHNRLMMQKVIELRRQEGLDPPVPSQIVEALDTAEIDMRTLIFKYTALQEFLRIKDSNGIQGNGHVDPMTQKDLESLMEEHVRVQTPNSPSRRGSCKLRTAMKMREAEPVEKSRDKRASE